MNKKINLSLILLLGLLLISVCVSAADMLSVSEFDYDNLSVTLSGNIGSSGVKTGAAYIVPQNTDINSINDTNLPVFTDIITTNSSGAFELNVNFLESGTAFTYGIYDVYLYSRDMSSPLKCSFTYLSPAQILANKKQAILDEVKNSQTWQGLRATVLGEDMAGNVINDNLAHINPDMRNYNFLKNKEKLFTEMYRLKANINSFDDIAAEFERISLALKTEEEAPGPQAQNPGVGSSGFGGSTPVMSNTPSKEDTTTVDGVSRKAFTDMDGHWAFVYVDTLAEQGIINGYDDGSFRPDNHVTRAELAKIIVAAFGIGGSGTDAFSDVPVGAWYASYVNAAAANGIVTGYDGRFNPDDNVTRQDAALMLHRAISRTHDIGIGYVFFADETSISAYAAEEVSALAEIGIITGNTENRFMPLDNLTRGEAAALISRASDYILAH